MFLLLELRKQLVVLSGSVLHMLLSVVCCVAYMRFAGLFAASNVTAVPGCLR